MQTHAELITGFPVFRGFTAVGARRLIDAGVVKQHGAGTVLLNEGDTSNFVLLVLTGKLEVYVERAGKDLILTESGPGAILGEVATLCGIPRSASVRTKEDSEVLEWSDDAFRSLLLRDPGLSQVIFGHAMRTLIENERSVIEALVRANK